MFPDSLIQHAELPPDSYRFAGHAGCIEGEENGLVQARHRLPRDIYMMAWGSGRSGFQLLQDDEGFDVQYLYWPFDESTATAMRSWIDFILANGNDHSGIVAVQWHDITTYLEETRFIIQQTGQYAWSTTKP